MPPERGLTLADETTLFIAIVRRGLVGKADAVVTVPVQAGLRTIDC